jgi:hypothetical protein
MSVISQSRPIVCAAGELAVLGALVDAPAIVGMEEPFKGLDRSEVAAALAESTNSLIERGFVQPEADDTLTLDSTVAAMMDIATAPARSYFCGLAAPHAKLERHVFHVRDSFAVELTPGARGSLAWRSRYTLLALDAVHGLSQRVSNIWRLSDQFQAPGERLQTTERALRTATAAASTSVAAAADVLVNAGATRHAANVLSETLASPLQNGVLVAFALDGSHRPASGLGFLEGHNGLWRLRAHREIGATRVDVVPCGALELKHELRWFLSRTL